MGEKLKQKSLPGFKNIRAESLEKLADRYVESRDEHGKLTDQLVERKQALLAAMKGHRRVWAAIKAHPKKTVRIGRHILVYTPEQGDSVKVVHAD